MNMNERKWKKIKIKKKLFSCLADSLNMEMAAAGSF
jgi:hypothetical protein